MENYQAKGKNMNRRNFLKSLATACGAAVVAPAVLLKSKCKHEWRLFGPGLECRCRLCDVRGNLGDAHLPWKNYTATYQPREELVHKMRQAFNDTKFKRPVPYGLKDDLNDYFWIQT